MSWFPGTTTRGRSSERSRRAALACCSGLLRCARSPVASTTSGSALSTSATRSASTSGSSRVPAWRSETCSTRRFGIGRGDYSESMVDEPAEIFDDMYLGLRAGAAERKKRRGEPLSAEEQELLGRWERLSAWRKTLAVGAFAVGTFGLGFTLGGLIFGRWRRA